MTGEGHGTGRTGTGGLGHLGVMHAQDELLTAYQHTVPPTRRPHAHTAPLTILFRNRTGPWLDKGGEVGGSIGPGPVSPAGWPSLPAPGPGFTLRGGRLHLGSQQAGPPLSLASHPLQ